MFVLIPEIENECQVVNNVLINHSLSLDKEHYNIISKSFDNDCYFHSIAILLKLSTEEIKNSLLQFVTNISNTETIQRLILGHDSSFTTLITRLSIGGNICGVYCDLYNELILKVYLVDIHTYYIIKDRYIYTIKTSNPQSSNKVIKLLLLHDGIKGHQGSFFPLKNI